ERRQSKRIKDLADIARLVENHPKLWNMLTDELKREVQRPDEPYAPADTTPRGHGG
ncbi:MAG: hypothetical protein GX594_09885, partial [Pirellulaceae bacterium]|nr:hypothetical protein [Pirellulaceae bacterium]